MISTKKRVFERNEKRTTKRGGTTVCEIVLNHLVAMILQPLTKHNGVVYAVVTNFLS